MRGHHRQAGFARQPHGRLRVGFVAVHAGALQFNVVAARKQVRPLARQRQCRHRVAGVQGLAHVAHAAARKRDQALLALQPFPADFRAALALVRQERLGQQFAQVQIALMVAHQQQQAERLGRIVVIAQPDITAGNGFDPRAACAFVELDQAEKVGQVGQRHGGLAQLGHALDQVGNAHNTVHHRELGVDAQMHKGDRVCYGFGHSGNCTQGSRSKPLRP
ncbi:hypothetical protein D3C73_561940 [compost metagenome]